MSDDPPRWQAETVPLAGTAGTGAEPARARSVFDPIEPRFDEVGELGRGGMGRVAEAVDRALARPVAVKYMLATDADAVARFEREVRITARLQHPGIVPILDAGRDADGRPYYVMRRIDGVPLSAKVGGATVRERLALVPAVLAAIDATAYAHARGVVHRDIKPSNILLGPFGETLLIDWGLARELDAGGRDPISVPPSAAADADLTRLGAAYGTPGFMSPEQARGEVADRRTDVYSLGASLYYVLAGTNPFPGSGPTQAIDRVAAGEALDLAAISDEVPVELTAIVAKAVAVDRDARYADAAELAADVRRFLAGQLVAAHRYTTGERLARWLRRHRLAATIAAIAIVTLAVGGVLSVTRILRERDRARTARAIAETRAEEAVLDRARSLVRVDPTSALAVVRTLPAASPRWPIAREIARAAVAGGVERLVARHDGGVHAVAYSPNGTLAAAWFTGAGTIEVFPRTGPARVVATHGATQLGWLDDHVLVAATLSSGQRSAVELIDTTTTTITPIAVTEPEQIAFADRAVVIRGKDGSVRTADETGGVTAIADAGIAAIDARAGRIALLGRDRLIVIEPDGTRRERAVELPGAPFRVHLAAGGARIAAAVGGAKIEWATFDDPRPALYPSATTGLSGLVYAGDTLYGWSTVAGGVVSFGDLGAQARWLAPTEGTIGYYAAGGPAAAIVASSDGALAYAGPAGAFAIPHRPVPVRAIAIDDAGTEVAIGTTEGELLRLDLSGAVPRLTPIPLATQLLAVGDDRLVVGSEPGTVQGFDLATPAAGAMPELGIVDLGTGATHAIAPLGFGTLAWIEAGKVVLVGGRPLVGVIADLDGHELYRGEVGATALSHTAFVAETPSHDVIRIDLATAGTAPPRVIAHVDDPIAELDTDGDRAVVVTYVPAGTFAVQLVDAEGIHPLDLRTTKMLSSIHQTSDGTWWYVEEFATLWRKPPGGAPIEVPVGQAVNLIRQDGDRVFAVSATTQFELALDGRIVRTTSVVGLAAAIDGGTVLRLPDAIAVTMPDVNVRRLLALGSEPQDARASHDGRLIASVVRRLDGDHAIALWRDPVPADPHELAAYIDGATNAHLDPGSDQVLWDAPAK